MRIGKDGGTLNSRLFDALRADILHGRLPPGQRLKASALATSHEVSLNVIREALNRLAGEGLVDFEPQLGFAVRRLSVEDLQDLVEQRIALESMALRRCIQRASVEWQSEVLAAHHRLSCTPMLEPGSAANLNPQWLARHEDFHSTVLIGCGSKRLYQMTRQMAEAAEIYHRALLPVADSEAEMAKEHQDLLEVILAGDADRAIEILGSHLETTRDRMLPMLRALEAATSGEMSSRGRLEEASF